ncbi:ribosome maturation factor RimP [Candidatus Methylospira mobilis]|uniref:ribosome maturation factor RimP n=1 Tax=Candidatus Methylospira mobilis TaxID=1808979 RepID=UPI0028EC203B|nr:ribosome maturation factor RimP [Candidatus Methylospira mobilis]WNV03836.1 ribosome maturation factor RimP [Candidatus Methylospira mobilis]
MRMPERLIHMIEPVVDGLGYELVSIEFDSGQRILRVYIDKEEGILVDDCSRVSHQLSGVLDVEDPIPGNYHLEVSSPGMDRPLSKPEHFARFQGCLVRLQMLRAVDGRPRRLKARIVGVSGGAEVTLQDGEDLFSIPFDLIEKARLVPEFEKISKE